MDKPETFDQDFEAYLVLRKQATAARITYRRKQKPTTKAAAHVEWQRLEVEASAAYKKIEPYWLASSF